MYDESMEQKKGALGDIMSFLDDVILQKMKSKKEPQAVSIEMQTAAPAADDAEQMAAMAEQEMPQPQEEESELTPELLAKLEEMYGK